VFQGEILRALHLHQARHGTLELEGAVAFDVELVGAAGARSR
jgi:hypothetical protein